MTPKFLLTRIAENSKAIYGILSVIEGDVVKYTCRTVENKEKSFPDGTYPIRYEMSARFNAYLWELYGIEGRAEIKIHVANYYSQLEGCIGVGEYIEDINHDNIPDAVGSRKALALLHAAMDHAKETTITVVTVSL